MTDLATRYLGLDLRSPIVASAGPLTGRIGSLRALEDAGIAAVVLPSLFEEQVVHDELSTTELFDLGSGANPEATSYFPDVGPFETISDRYLRHLEAAKGSLGVPVIASLNGVTPGGWARYARALESAGADAIELNLYTVPTAPTVSGVDIEAGHLELVGAVSGMVAIPVAVKVGPFYSAFAHMATKLAEAGAAGLVLFNRFYQPDLDPDTWKVNPSLDLSTSAELRLPLRWIAILHGRVDASLAATTGIHTGRDVAKAVLAGADVTMTTSALLLSGPGHVATMEAELLAWAAELDIASIATVRGAASHRHVADPAGFERANYLQVMVDYANTFASGQEVGPW